MAAALETLLSAGVRALDEARWPQARDAFLAAAEIEVSGAALLGASNALWWLGELDRSVEHKARAFAHFRAAEDHEQAALTALLLCLDYRKQYGDPVASAGWLAQGRRLVEEHELESLLGWLLFTSSFDCDDAVRSEQLARDAHRFATACADRDLELCALSQIGAALVAQGRVADGIACLDESMAVALAAQGSPDTVVFASCMMMTSCTRSAEFARAAHWVRRTIAFTERYGCPFLYAECRILYGAVLLATGDWRAAEQELRAGLDLTRGAVPALHRLALATLAELWLVQGRVEQAEQLVAGHDHHVEMAPVVARLHLVHDRAPAAVALLRRSVEGQPAPADGGALLLELLGDAELQAGDRAAAAVRADRLCELADAGSSPLLRARADRLSGRVAATCGDLALARRRLDAALVAFARLEMLWEVVRTRLLLAEALAEVESEVAVAEARAALAAAETLGAGGEADRAAALLRALGVPAARQSRRENAPLTKREEHVLALLGEGLSNPEIAARLHLSRKTVEHHVAHVLSKLAVRNRTQAAAEAVRRQGAVSAAK